MASFRHTIRVLSVSGLVAGLAVSCTPQSGTSPGEADGAAVVDAAPTPPGTVLPPPLPPPDAAPAIPVDAATRDASDASIPDDAAPADASQVDAGPADAAPDAADAADGAVVASPCGAAEARLCKVGEACGGDADCVDMTSCVGNVCFAPCPVGTYPDAPGSATCASCPDNFTTAGAGAASAAECVACPATQTSSEQTRHQCIVRKAAPFASAAITGTSCNGTGFYFYGASLSVSTPAGAAYRVRGTMSTYYVDVSWGVAGGPVVSPDGSALSGPITVNAYTANIRCGIGGGQPATVTWGQSVAPTVQVEYWDPATRQLQFRLGSVAFASGGRLASSTGHSGYVAAAGGPPTFSFVVP